MVSMVFERFPLGGGIRLLALALADSASSEGEDIYPSVARMARHTFQSERAVQYQLRQLTQMGWLRLVRATGNGRGHPNEYRIDPGWIEGGVLVVPAPQPKPVKGANIAPFISAERVQSEAERVQSDTIKGATAIAPEQLLTTTTTPCPNLRSDAGGQDSKPEGKVADSDDLRLASWMFDLVLKLHPRHKPPNLPKWANEIRLMRERDQHDRREIAALFRWANGHAFWQSNILSPAKLRERWDQLEIRRKADAAMPGAAASKPPPVIDRQCAFFEHGIRCTCAGVTSTGNHPSSPWYCAPHLERVEQGDTGDPVPGKGVGFGEVRV